MLQGKEREDALAQMRACYADAENLAKQRGEPTFYSQLMVETADILKQHAIGAKAQSARGRRLRELADAQRLKLEAEPDNFWTGVAVGDALLLAAIGDGEISKDEEESVVLAYLEPWRRGGSRLKLSSVTEQLEFLAAMLADGPRVRACLPAPPSSPASTGSGSELPGRDRRKE